MTRRTLLGLLLSILALQVSSHFDFDLVLLVRIFRRRYCHIKLDDLDVNTEVVSHAISIAARRMQFNSLPAAL